MDVLTELVAKITTDASGLKKGLSDAEGATEKASQNMAASLKKVGIAMAAAGAAITAAMGLAAKSAMDAVESENLFNASLGKNAKVVREWSNTLGKALGLNTYELRKNTGTIYVMVQSMGIAGDAAMDMSKGITELAYDMASFYNISPEEAFGKLKSGLVGMSRPLQDLGILVNETTIKAYALKTGLIEEGQEMTEQQKVTARYGAILEATTVAQGDLARTMDSPTNKLRVLSSTFDELKIVLGEHLLPIIGSLMTGVGSVLDKIINWAKENPALAKTLTIITASLGVVLTVVGGLILLWPILTGLVAAFGVVLHAALGPIGLISLAITGLIAAGILLYKYWNNVVDFIEMSTNWVIGYLNKLIDALNSLPFIQLSHVADVSFQSLKRTTKAVDELAAAQGELQGVVEKTGKVIVDTTSEATESMEGLNKSLQDGIRQTSYLAGQATELLGMGGGEFVTEEEWRKITGAWSKMQGPGFNVAPFASGGIIDKPTVALMGENGREAVIPLEGEDRMPIDNVITTNIILDGKVVGRSVSKYLGEATLRRSRMGG